MRIRAALFLFLFLIAGCGSSAKNLVKVPVPTNSPRVTTEYVPDTQTIPEVSQHENRYSYDNAYREPRFSAENNPCIFADYVVVSVENIEESQIIIEIGNHCNELGKDGIVFLQKSDLESFPNEMSDSQHKGKLFYRFPDDFQPVNYLDYVDHAYRLELME
ncbi:hypothetical protein [Holdemania massiliensis]|uniref:hypothetical protein n=1 Tax=Holdemania massiliensis TaxID=1468449 RepID=UPI001F05DB3D|nr:hypothetical protein [Holdemania massiliensis]MCH1939362.1 hypothetical protein [Holdemania massiliensis]